MSHELRAKPSGSVLLHICCGICAGGAIQRLRDEGYSVTGFFYNPNIHPDVEYRKRLDAALAAGKILEIEMVVGDYDKDKWLERVKGFESEQEGGNRCSLCFRIRLEETHRKAMELGLSYIASTLSISPHKSTAVINQIGQAVGRDTFLPYDFKKKDGFKRSSEFSRIHELYRQTYCGCLYSRSVQ
jgi:predicted adenine nucleotide alpha hydrolase (AANH) superfamily ATPase